MKYLYLDVETSNKHKGNPFTRDNKLVLVGMLYEDKHEVFVIEHNQVLEPYNKKLERVQELINGAEYIVGFNIKFDIHWLRRYGIKIPDCKVWDCQLAYHIHYDQQPPSTKIGYPSLNDVCSTYNLGKKDDTIEKEYWDMGIDSMDIPLDKFIPYLHLDLSLTADCHRYELAKISEAKKRLVELQCLDVLVLQEMEFNGIKYNKDRSIARAESNSVRIAAIDVELGNLVTGSYINWSSGEHKSVILYGGIINEEIRTPYIKADGSVSTSRTNLCIVEHLFPRLVTPIKGSELKKAGYFSTDEGTFKKLKAKGKAKVLIDLWLERTALMKETNTYYKGIPDLMHEMQWGDYIHGNLNTCVAVTGRLSSSKPNLQNNPSDINLMMESRFDI